MELVMTKRELANKILDELFAGAVRIPIAAAAKIAKENKVSMTTLRRASRDQGVKGVHNGNQPAFWEKGDSRETR